MKNTKQNGTAALAPRRSLLAPRGFTLVELLVVITIIAILSALVTVAAISALKSAQRSQVKVEINSLGEALETYKDKAGSYPPNLQIDDPQESGAEPAATPLVETQVFSDLRRHMKQAFGRSKEPDDLLRVLCGLAPGDATNFPNILRGGMTGGEAIVFWIGGFSSDPEHPISGEGGPSYDITANGFANSNNRTLDPVEGRKKIYDFDVSRFGPKLDDGYFDQTSNRFIEYAVKIDGLPRVRRINFWQYVPKKSTQPYVYFDVSRHPALVATGPATFVASFDPPAATALTGLNSPPVFAIKKASESTGSNVPYDFANAGKYQILHCGIDDKWGDNFVKMTLYPNPPNTPAVNEVLLFPTGPFTEDLADTQVNFTQQAKIEDATP